MTVQKRRQLRLHACIFTLLLVLAGTGTIALAENILLLNSYHQRMPWVADIVQGLEDVIKPDKNNYLLHIENMDTKAFHSEEYFTGFRDYLTIKYRSSKPDLIFSSDNNAYDFLRENRDLIFPGVPVVFCGVNNFDDEQIVNSPEFTGVAEIFSARETVELALTLQPDIKKVFVINDYLKTGRLWAQDIDTALAGLTNQGSPLIVEHSENISFEELQQKVGSLAPDTIVLFGAYFADNTKKGLQYERVAAQLSQATAVPIYCLVSFIIDEGLLGGQVISGYYQGYSMGQIGLSILVGADADTLPVMLKGSNKPVINYGQLVRFGLDETRLPANTEIINRPYSFYQEYKTQVWILLGFVISLLITILALVLNTRRLRRARSDLLRGEDRFRQLSNATWEALIIHDGETLLQANELFTEMFGYEPEELTGKPLLSTLLTRETLAEVLDKLAADHKGLVEATGKHKNGKAFPLEIRTREIEYNERMVQVAAIRDLSERKYMEEQLSQSQKLEAIGTLAGGIAHDFNNILSAIIGYCELTMLGLPKDSTATRNLESILGAGNRAKLLVQQILTFAHKSEQKQEPVKVSLVVMEAIKLIRASMPSTIEITTELQSDSLVFSDPIRIHQIVMNLCTNAGKAMPDGGLLKVTVKDVDIGDWFIARYPDITEGPYVRIMISDTGVGIPEEIRSRIFDPFFTTRKKSDGTGLGLSVVHGIVRESGGLITHRSNQGKGTIFDVYLPIIENLEGLPLPQKEELPRGEGHIMLVDDETLLLDIGTRSLETLGYTVDPFDSSPLALATFRADAGRYDLLITDMTMPKMKGDKLTREILALRPDLPVIMCTGFAEDFTEQDARMIGVAKYLIKPVNIINLAKAVHDVLT